MRQRVAAVELMEFIVCDLIFEREKGLVMDGGMKRESIYLRLEKSINGDGRVGRQLKRRVPQ